MDIPFNKYHGTGNDFIIIDNRTGIFAPSGPGFIKTLCDRRFGIGADGLIVIGPSVYGDFRMTYYNSDGYEGTMCGNGGRCAAHFALRSGIAREKMSFSATDGFHRAEYINELIRLSMNDIPDPVMIKGSYFINTGSPHYVVFTEDPDTIDVFQEGKKLRWSSDFPEGGTNVNFVKADSKGLYVRTFERGVEDETLSCGTGVTASAIAAVLSGHFVSSPPVNVRTRGGDLSVDFRLADGRITDVWLTGPATFVFEGYFKLD
ncbi:MAG: diaminopimelate epimerase [Bacteroidales bacterium]|nr:diaminopimelate epimerase [Bacteroidales bacterium]